MCSIIDLLECSKYAKLQFYKLVRGLCDGILKKSKKIMYKIAGAPSVFVVGSMVDICAPQVAYTSYFYYKGVLIEKVRLVIFLEHSMKIYYAPVIYLILIVSVL